MGYGKQKAKASKPMMSAKMNKKKKKNNNNNKVTMTSMKKNKYG